jgi:nuclear-control-of-ATPase protein 2
MDRILSSAQPSENGVLYYKDYGLLLCEAHVLRQVAVATIREEAELREFLRDLEELTEVEIGVGRQKDVVRRMRWGYSKWM